MIITVEISHYPLSESYETPIKGLIKAFHASEGVRVYTNAMSTYLQGDYDKVMHCITTSLKECLSEELVSSTVMKIIPGKLPIGDGFRDYLG